MSRLARVGPPVAAGLLVVVGLVAYAGLLPVPTGAYDQQQLQITDCDATQVATLDVRVAESAGQRYVGLSRTDELADGEGMVFPGDENRDRRIVMRGMTVGLDVLFVDADGRITSIVTLPAPDGPVERHLTYPGTSRRGQSVIEVPAGWTNRTGVGVGDCVEPR